MFSKLLTTNWPIVYTLQCRNRKDREKEIVKDGQGHIVFLIFNFLRSPIG